MAAILDHFENESGSNAAKPLLSIANIINMSFGFMGIQMGFALQNGNMSRIFESFGVAESNLPFLWLAGPVTGLLIQPIIGYFSDRTWSEQWGRRRPYFMIGAFLAMFSLCLMPNAPTWVLAGILFWIMDASFNVAMEPFRALVGDKLPVSQRTVGFAAQTVFIGVGALIASYLPTILTSMGVSNIPAPGQMLPDTVKWSFYVGALGFFLCVMYTVFTTKEYAPGEYGNPIIHEKKGIFADLGEAFTGIFKMPKEMAQLAVVQFFSWFGLFAMWIYTTSAVTKHLYHTSDKVSAAYNEGANLVGASFGTYNIVSAGVAFLLPLMAAKLSRKLTHTICLVIGGLSLLSIQFLTEPSMLHFSMIGVGFAWASILTMPYAMLTNVLPADKMGYFVGVFNFFIVLPQMLAGVSLGFIINYLGGGDSMAAIIAGGISMIIAGVLSLRVQDKGD